jgi:hypothetical protein
MAGVSPPRRVDLSEADYQKLRQIYQRAYLRIAQELKDATDFGRANRAVLLKQISSIMSDYGTDVKAFIEKEMPEQYQKGAEQALTQLDALGVDVKTISTFSAIDKDAVAAIVTQTQQGIGAAMQGVQKNMTTLLSSAGKARVKELLTQGTISGEARQTIKKQIVADFQESGIGSLEDAGGKTWQLDSYADMLVRTNAASARNAGISNKVLESGNDLVEISDSNSDHPACADWEGEIVSLSGDSDQYPSLDDATNDGLFHPNCQHTYSPYVEGLSDQSGGEEVADDSG